jgi:hypothetical protein
MSRQTISTSTWSANHHRTSRAGETIRSTTGSSFRAAQDRSAIEITSIQVGLNSRVLAISGRSASRQT